MAVQTALHSEHGQVLSYRMNGVG